MHGVCEGRVTPVDSQVTAVTVGQNIVAVVHTATSCFSGISEPLDCLHVLHPLEQLTIDQLQSHVTLESMGVEHLGVYIAPPQTFTHPHTVTHRP